MNQSHTPQASVATFTPTHTAEGRKLTRAERKAANKAKWAAMQAERKQATTPKPERKPTRAERKAANKAAHAAAQAARAEERKQASKPKRKAKPSSNERMEARAQRESIRTQEHKRAKERAKATKVVSAIDGGEAMPFEPRMEVPVDVVERKRPVLESEPLSEYEGLTLTEASNLRLRRYLLECEDVCMDDCI